MVNTKKVKEKMQQLWNVYMNQSILGKTFESVTTKDTYNSFWNCDYDNLECPITKKSPLKVYQSLYNGSPVCDYCKGKQFEGSIQEVAPLEVDKYWHEERNKALGFFSNKKQAKSNDMVHVKCDTHQWGIVEIRKSRCADLANHHIPCPQCSGKKVTKDNNLKIKFPTIADELHPAFNPELILPSSSEILPWRCALCNDYYLKKVSLRTNQGHGCPVHNSTHKYSKTESLLFLIFNEIIGNFEKYKLHDLKWLSGHRVEIDLFNCFLQVAIEYDGYQHKKESQVKSDQAKNAMIQKYNGILLFIRIRERGLPQLEFFENQIEVICEKHEQSYKFLIPAIQKTLQIINERYNIINISTYSVEKLTRMIKDLLPRAEGNAYYPNETFGDVAPGILGHLDPINRDPFDVAKGSNHTFYNVTCPNCEYLFSNHKSKAKILIKSKALCNNCNHYVEDIQKKDSPLIMRQPKNKIV